MTEPKRLQISDEDFAEYVRLTSLSDNAEDNRRRADFLGLDGKDILVAPGAIIRVPEVRAHFGQDIFIGLYAYINGNVTIGDHVLIGPHCSLAAGNHKFDPKTGYFSARTEQDYDNSIVVGCGSWLASKVTVTAGVKIGRANLVCAGAVVTHSTPDYAIIAGVPAKQIGRIDPETGKYHWFSKEQGMADDDIPPLNEPTESFPAARENGRQFFPFPEENRKVYENPPAFVWLPLPSDNEHNIVYRVTVRDDRQNIVFTADVTGCTCAPEKPLPVGAYTWDVEALGIGARRGAWRFEIAEDAVRFERPSAEEVIAGIPDEYPRLLFTKAEIPQIKADHSAELETLRRNIARAYQDGLPEYPRFHYDGDALPYREYFGRFRDFCDRNLVACALGYQLLGDERAGEFAKKLFLHICGWNPLGPCELTGAWGDEIGLSCARCFPAVFDLIKPLLDAKQRRFCASVCFSYALQCEERLTRLDYIKNPGESHSGRLPAYLGSAALALWGEERIDPAVLTRWLDYALRIYGGMFPYYGTPDGGWAEGAFYSTSYTKWYLPFFSAVARFSGKSLLNRPFYRNYARFLLHFALPDHELHPFGDGYWCTPDSPEWPGFFAQNPFRVYAELSGLDKAKAYDRQLAAPELYSLHLLDVFLPSLIGNQTSPTAPVTDADMFPDSGFVSLHSDRTDPAHDLHLMARASRFGPGSHRQPDNGSFALFCGGTALIAPSGYFGRAYGSKHHMKWYNTTKAHNALLIDGSGQDYGNFRHTARIVSCGIEDGVRCAVLDMRESYPMLKKWLRTFRLTDSHTLIIIDEVEAEKPVTVTYPLHFLSKPVQRENTIEVSRNGHELTVKPESGCFASLTLSDRYDVDLNEGEPEEFHVSRPAQFHAYYETEPNARHQLIVTYSVDKN